MTREEAIAFFKDMNECTYDNLEPIQMAIEALEQELCGDTISRQATIDAIYKKHIGGKDAIENAPINDLYACGLEEAIDAVDNMPSITPQPKTGHWIAADGDNAICGCCNRLNRLYGTYCKHCGAKMEV